MKIDLSVARVRVCVSNSTFFSALFEKTGFCTSPPHLFDFFWELVCPACLNVFVAPFASFTALSKLSWNVINPPSRAFLNSPFPQHQWTKPLFLTSVFFHHQHHHQKMSPSPYSVLVDVQDSSTHSPCIILLLPHRPPFQSMMV